MFEIEKKKEFEESLLLPRDKKRRKVESASATDDSINDGSPAVAATTFPMDGIDFGNLSTDINSGSSSANSNNCLLRVPYPKIATLVASGMNIASGVNIAPGGLPSQANAHLPPPPPPRHANTAVPSGTSPSIHGSLGKAIACAGAPSAVKAEARELLKGVLMEAQARAGGGAASPNVDIVALLQMLSTDDENGDTLPKVSSGAIATSTPSATSMRTRTPTRTTTDHSSTTMSAPATKRVTKIAQPKPQSAAINASLVEMLESQEIQPPHTHCSSPRNVQAPSSSSSSSSGASSSSSPNKSSSSRARSHPSNIASWSKTRVRVPPPYPPPGVSIGPPPDAAGATRANTARRDTAPRLAAADRNTVQTKKTSSFSFPDARAIKLARSFASDNVSTSQESAVVPSSSANAISTAMFKSRKTASAAAVASNDGSSVVKVDTGYVTMMPQQKSLPKADLTLDAEKPSTGSDLEMPAGSGLGVPPTATLGPPPVQQYKEADAPAPSDSKAFSLGMCSTMPASSLS